ncbi:MAG: ATP-binding protein [Desulfobacterales bacterium]
MTEESPHKLFTFRRKWKLLVLLTTLVAVIPLVLMTVFSLGEAHQAVLREIMLQTRQQVAAAAHTVPHMVIQPNGELNFAAFQRLRDDLELGPGGDAFIIDASGTLQTPSRHYGKLHRLAELPPALADRTANAGHVQVRSYTGSQGATLLLGYAAIPDSPLTLMVIRDKRALMEPWRRMRLKVIALAGGSIVLILIGILGMATYMVHRIHDADGRRTEVLRRMAYANKMASIGRLSAGVAHELNNPLEIINSKAGLIQDMFRHLPQYTEDPKLNGLLNDILANIQRCGKITRRLLNLASGSANRVEPTDIGSVTSEILAFLEQDAAYRNITIRREIDPQLPPVTCDRGNLQQILLNLFNNAFQALQTGGCLDVSVKPINGNQIQIAVANDGPAMAEKDIAHVFDPFYFAQTDEGGAGLGLSVTYGLVQQMNARIQAESEVGQGTRFTFTLPASPLDSEPPTSRKTASHGR